MLIALCLRISIANSNAIMLCYIWASWSMSIKTYIFGTMTQPDQLAGSSTHTKSCIFSTLSLNNQPLWVPSHFFVIFWTVVADYSSVVEWGSGTLAQWKSLSNLLLVFAVSIPSLKLVLWFSVCVLASEHTPLTTDRCGVCFCTVLCCFFAGWKNRRSSFNTQNSHCKQKKQQTARASLSLARRWMPVNL